MIRRFAIFAFALIMILVLSASVTQARGPVAESSIQGIYVVRIYGNTVLLLLNKSAMRFINGFWVVEGVNMVDLTQQILNIVGSYTVEGARAVISDGKACVVGYNRSCMEVERLGDDFAYVVSALIRAGLRIGSLELYRHSDNTLRILMGMGIVESVGIDKIVSALSTLNRRVVVEEVVAVGRIISCFDAPELCNATASTPCFTSFAETAYGLQITLGCNCVKRLAEERNTSIDEAVGLILERLKPLVDKYFDQRPLVAIEPEVRGVPLPLVVPRTSTTSGSKAEEPQRSNAVNTVTSTSTPMNTQNLGTVSVDRNSILMATAFSSVAIALILIIVSKRTLIRHRTLST
ncbi:MAG: hypothetical protein B7O98_02645 [Zestosphaera tikiterensis]|uniref:Uncharacterized protein n=1 Tax=Zestosphaera tikiterensis TaxID=1973259 RepID=A0A2R7Y735_9CREN|nr:MAG: hypothetical protein B7O98_02645 [Zestosphaera tikiterensis]